MQIFLQRMNIMSDSINKITVTIGGKSFNLSGQDSPEKLQRVADYLNRVNEECEQQESYKNLPYDQKGLLVQLNIADDYFKALDATADVEGRVTAKDDEIYNIKHELVTAQMKNEQLSRDLKEANSKIESLNQRIKQLENKSYRR